MKSIKVNQDVKQKGLKKVSVQAPCRSRASSCMDNIVCPCSVVQGKGAFCDILPISCSRNIAEPGEQSRELMLRSDFTEHNLTLKEVQGILGDGQ